MEIGVDFKIVGQECRLINKKGDILHVFNYETYNYYFCNSAEHPVQHDSHQYILDSLNFLYVNKFKNQIQ